MSPWLYIPQCLFLTLLHGQLLRTSLRFEQKLNASGGRPITSSEHARFLGTASLCTLKHRFSFSLSIHQNLEVSSVNPPILSTLIHLFVKLKSRLLSCGEHL